MEYSIQSLSKLAKISTRTLRYYDEINLLKPLRINSSGYRIYGSKEVDRLQQILFYRELGFTLTSIADLIDHCTVPRLEVLNQQLITLLSERSRLDCLIQTLQKTILYEKGQQTMNDNEKFEGFKKKLMQENESAYGKELRAAYSEQTLAESREKFMNLKEEDYNKMQKIAAELNQRLEQAVLSKISKDSQEAQNIAMLHKQWLTFTWPTYSKEAHLGLVQMYLADERFKNYYDSSVKGCAQFLYEAVTTWIGIE